MAGKLNPRQSEVHVFYEDVLVPCAIRTGLVFLK